MINIYHKPDFDLISLDIWADILLFLEVHPTYSLKRVCVCDKFYKKSAINEEHIVSELLWVLFHKCDSTLITIDFYHKNKWVCMQFELDIMKYMYNFEEEIIVN